MADMLEQASNWLEDQRTEHTSRTVTYERGAATVALVASIGRTIFEVDNGFGVVERTESRDFLALAAEVNKMTSRKLDLNTFWHWFQKSTK